MPHGSARKLKRADASLLSWGAQLLYCSKLRYTAVDPELSATTGSELRCTTASELRCKTHTELRCTANINWGRTYHSELKCSANAELRCAHYLKLNCTADAELRCAVDASLGRTADAELRCTAGSKLGRWLESSFGSNKNFSATAVVGTWCGGNRGPAHSSLLAVFTSLSFWCVHWEGLFALNHDLFSRPFLLLQLYS